MQLQRAHPERPQALHRSKRATGNFPELAKSSLQNSKLSVNGTNLQIADTVVERRVPRKVCMPKHVHVGTQCPHACAQWIRSHRLGLGA